MSADPIEHDAMAGAMARLCFAEGVYRGAINVDGKSLAESFAAAMAARTRAKLAEIGRPCLAEGVYRAIDGKSLAESFAAAMTARTEAKLAEIARPRQAEGVFRGAIDVGGKSLAEGFAVANDNAGDI